MTRPDGDPLLAAAILHHAHTHPDVPAVATAGRTLTYRQLVDAAAPVTAAVVAAGAGPGRLVGLSCPRDLHGLVGLVGIVLSGAGWVYLDPRWPAARTSRALAQCVPPIVLTGSGLDELLLRLDRPAPAALPPVPAVGPDDPAYVIYTSGSTGLPKGVLLTQGGLAHTTARLAEVFDVGPRVRVAQVADLSWDASVAEFATTWAAGGTVVPVPDDTRSGGEAMAGFLRQMRVNVVTLTPTVLAALPADHLPTVRTVCSVGDTCTPQVVDQWWAPGRVVLNGYGPTEATVAVTVGQCQRGRPVTIGRPLHGVTVRVVDDNGLPRVAGELWVGGAGVAAGYLGAPVDGRPTVGDSSGRFLTLDGQRWYRTGDLVTRGADGTLSFVGRLDDQIKLRGYRIEPGEVEAVICRHSAVAACVVGVSGGRLTAWAQTSDPDLTAAELRVLAADGLPEHMVPAVIHLVGWLPVTDVGKVDRAAVLRMPVTPPAADDGVDELTAAVLDVIRAVLGPVWTGVPGDEPVQVGPDDDVFDVGGDSLLATRIAVAMYGRLGVPVTALNVTDHPTAAALAALLRPHLVPEVTRA